VAIDTSIVQELKEMGLDVDNAAVADAIADSQERAAKPKRERKARKSGAERKAEIQASLSQLNAEIEAVEDEAELDGQQTKSAEEAERATPKGKAKGKGAAPKAKAAADVVEVELPDEIGRGWLAEKIRELATTVLDDKGGPNRAKIAASLTKALGREVRYQQVFQTLKQAELKASRPLPEGAVTCKICGTVLTAEDSVEAGIGPICEDKHGR
jgi:TolA-binding protein